MESLELECTDKPRSDERVINLLDEHARERAGMGSSWSPYRYEAVDGPDFPTLITGAIAPLITRGKNAGERNWRKMDKSTERRIVISRSEHNAFKEEWSKRTGKCHGCVGTGKIVTGWSLANGTRYAQCARCGGVEHADA